MLGVAKLRWCWGRPPMRRNGGLVGEVLASTESLLGRAVSYGFLALEVVTTFVLVVIGGVFLASNPGLYRRRQVRSSSFAQVAWKTARYARKRETLRQWLDARSWG